MKYLFLCQLHDSYGAQNIVIDIERPIRLKIKNTQKTAANILTKLATYKGDDHLKYLWDCSQHLCVIMCD